MLGFGVRVLYLGALSIPGIAAKPSVATFVEVCSDKVTWFLLAKIKTRERERRRERFRGVALSVRIYVFGHIPGLEGQKA